MSRTSRLRALGVLLAAAGLLPSMLASTSAGAATADVTPPVLTSVTLDPGPYGPNDIVTIGYTFTDDSPVTRAEVTLASVTSSRVHTVAETGDPVTGSMSLQVPAGAYTGDYAISKVLLTDAAGNSATFYRGGYVTGSPNPPTATSHSLPFSTTYLTITGTANDGEPPRLTALTMVKTATYAEEPFAFSYKVTDASLPLKRIQLSLHNPGLLGNPYTYEENVGATGTLTTAGPLPGPTTVASVTITDAKGNESTYVADGKIWGFVAADPIDFAPLALTLRPAAPGANIRDVPCGASLDLGVSSETAALLSGYRVTVNPGARVFDLPMGKLNTVTHHLEQKLSVPGLTNGVTYTVSVVAKSQWGDSRPFTRSILPLPTTNFFSPGDMSGDGRADVVALLEKGLDYGDGSGQITTPVYLYPGTGTGGFRTRSIVEREGYFERIAADGAAGTTAAFYGQSAWYGLERYDRWGGALSVSSSRAWSSMRFVDGGADFSGDGYADILAVAKTGELYRYRVGSSHSIIDRKQIGSGWGSFLAVFTPGDFTGDRKADVIALDTAGRLWLYRGSGTGGWVGARTQIGSGWGGFASVFALRDFTGDGRMDVGAVAMTGELYVYPGNGRGGWVGGRKQIGAGWQAFF